MDALRDVELPEALSEAPREMNISVTSCCAAVYYSHMPHRLPVGPDDFFARAEDVLDLDAIRAVLSSGDPPLGQRIARHQPRPPLRNLWEHLEGVEFVVDGPRQRQELDVSWLDEAWG